jgi:hypothetical protein
LLCSSPHPSQFERCRPESWTGHHDTWVKTSCTNCCPHLTRFTWNGSSVGPSFSGVHFRHAANLTEVYLDGASLEIDSGHIWAIGGTRPNYDMLVHCHHFQRVSIKNKRFSPSLPHYPPVSQDTIMKFARRTPTLRWLRSDLTSGNVAVLLQERPDIIFVMD